MTQTHVSGRGMPDGQPKTAFYRRGSTRVVGLALACLLLVLAIAGTPLLAGRPASAAMLRKLLFPNNALMTYKDDNFRSGQNANETILNTGNVNSSQFGLRVTYPVDGNVYAEPLYVPNLTINGSTHNVVFVATENDSVYAFDADAKSAGAPLWHASFINPGKGITPVQDSDIGCNNITPQIGITGTPVIDPGTNILYVVAATKENGVFYQRLHALNILNGQETSGSPVAIAGSVKGTGDGSVNGVVAFDPHMQLQRPALLLNNGNVYIAFGSHCDINPYHGWVFGYNTASLKQSGIFNVTANGKQGAIWQSGDGLAADNNGYIYFMSGNGSFDKVTGGVDLGDSFVKLSTTNGLSLADYFTPFNEQCMDSTDLDLGSGGVMLVPNSNEIISAGKEGRIYVVNTSNMGKFTTIFNPCGNENRTNVDKIIQETSLNAIGGLWSSPAYWHGSTGNYVYFGGNGSQLVAYSLTNGLLSSSQTSKTPETFGYPGCNPSVSSNGMTAGTGIVWCVDPAGYLRAYDASNLGHELYNHGIGGSIKFTTVAEMNGRVIVGTTNSVQIYGLLN